MQAKAVNLFRLLPHRICKQCKEIKLNKEFYLTKTKYDGIRNICKLCQKEYHQKHWITLKKLKK